MDINTHAPPAAAEMYTTTNGRFAGPAAAGFTAAMKITAAA